MSKKSIRFGVTDGKGNRSSTWNCFAANPPKKDVYLACREIGGSLKASLHESGNWHIAYNKKFFDQNIVGDNDTDKSRFIEKWSKPPEIAHGLILAFRIVIPWGSVRTPIEKNIKKNIHWVAKPSEGKAIEFDLIITVKKLQISN